jgi:phosphoglycolate phosphatase-like HAD superfamily hydrolase
MYDGRAAASHGIAFIGVLWGYGARDELMDAGARDLVARWSDLPKAIAMHRMS